MTIYLDLDGTVIDFYGVPNWLECLEAQDSTPYRVAKPLVNLSTLARYLNRLQARGYNIGIISWLSKSGTDKFNAEVAEVKRDWLAKHLPSVQWDEIHIVPYGVPKSTCATCPASILFDDEQRNLNEWTANTHNMAYNADLLMEILRNL
jgi:hypothetical protein